MDEPTLRQLLDDVRAGVVSADDAVARLRRLPFADLGFARIDHHRSLRQGLPEAVYGPGKTAQQCADIVAELLAVDSGDPVLLTRATDDQAGAALARNPGGTRRGSTVVWRPADPDAERRPARWRELDRRGCCVRCAHGSIRSTPQAAPEPLSMPTTVSPAAQLDSIASSAVTPSSDAP
jgi:hypothetical protein